MEDTDPYQDEYPKPEDVIIEINFYRDRIRRLECRLDQFEHGVVEVMRTRRYRNNAPLTERIDKRKRA